MSDGPTFTEIIVSKLGTPKDETSGFQDFLAFTVLMLAFAVYFGIEYGFGRITARIWRLIQPDAPSKRAPRSEP